MISCNALTLDDELPQALPTIVKSTSAMPIEMPEDVHPDLVHLINNYRQLFSIKRHLKHLHQALVSPPILDYPTHNDHFVLTTDTSHVGLGAILSTLSGIVVEYTNRSLNSTERKYSTTEKECLGIV